MVLHSGERQLEFGSEAEPALNPDANSVPLGDVFDNSQTQAGGFFIMLYGLLGAIVLFKNMRQLIRGDAYAVVLNGNDCFAVRFFPAANMNKTVFIGINHRVG